MFKLRTSLLQTVCLKEVPVILFCYSHYQSMENEYNSLFTIQQHLPQGHYGLMYLLFNGSFNPVTIITTEQRTLINLCD